MPSIRLAVTRRVLDIVNAGHEEQRQIAMRDPSAEIQDLIRGATAQEVFALDLGGRVTLTVGDSGAIWRVHQLDRDRADFDSIFELLARRPGIEMEFLCEAT